VQYYFKDHIRRPWILVGIKCVTKRSLDTMTTEKQNITFIQFQGRQFFALYMMRYYDTKFNFNTFFIWFWFVFL